MPKLYNLRSNAKIQRSLETNSSSLGVQRNCLQIFLRGKILLFQLLQILRLTQGAPYRQPHNMKTH